MFEKWPEQFTPSMRRPVDPPLAVLVDLGVAIPTDGVFRRDHLPMRVKAGGLNLSGRVSGRLHAWARVNDGSWLGLVSLSVSTGNDHGRLDITQWCPARALVLPGAIGSQQR
ncbi:hypothetical protein [Nocardia yamanashiensis]|uniref:hypothetical protein n=1 Tax=Nocardia yamanashiensis TaxID=209247 RepID=UPI000AA14C6E|nr:hypothetical protein [Nocardia yamanashiensis]